MSLLFHKPASEPIRVEYLKASTIIEPTVSKVQKSRNLKYFKLSLFFDWLTSNFKVKGSLDIFSTEKESRGIGPFPEWTATIYKKIARRQSDVRLQKLRNSFRSDNSLTRFENTTSCSSYTNLLVNLISYQWKKFEREAMPFPGLEMAGCQYY